MPIEIITIDDWAAFEDTLPSVAQPIASYVMSVQTGNLIYTSGVLPLEAGKVAYTGPVGSVLVPIESGKQAARLCALNLLSVLKDKLGTLRRVEQIVKLTGYVQSLPTFTSHAQVVNGASDLLVEVFGEKGKHARSSIGLISLPLNASVELDLVVQVS